ncbi:hypothetical protein [Bradyrhizobium sp. BR 10289]|uniref:hypothetical protein n=1 Tax=Bradyrhizobium sp. BR 10289 TaxID=2749993 RepID=UPI001E4FECD9|nr:hypothetical protein [Bradyrhizobium sp. BR 10289]
MTLRRIDVAGFSPHLQDIAEQHTSQNALDWQLDPSAAIEIEAWLQTHGFDEHAVNMEVYVQAREMLSLFEALLNGAKLRRIVLFKELTSMRRARSDRIALTIAPSPLARHPIAKSGISAAT